MHKNARADKSIMRWSVGYLLKVTAAFVIVTLLLVTFAGTVMGKADARADINNYIGQPPNSWEPSQHGTNGTACKLCCDNCAGWDHMKGLGNVGIGNGSTAVFGTKDGGSSNYTDQYFMADDISTVPPDGYDSAGVNQISASGLNSGLGLVNKNAISPGEMDNSTLANDTAANTTSIINNSSGNNTTGNGSIINSSPSSASATMPGISTGSTHPNLSSLRFSDDGAADTRHTINLGKPVDDLINEHPFATSVSMYGRLTGLMTPGGIPVNIGMRALGYGY